ncbi:MAG: hydroxypyruvate isomerase [Sulfobacillus thermotolerans]|uniref:Hydroxypyruvate isomerase n=1 Tax=Sulfobacillus thermotolerans TaxID=338644 RepID=A0ABM6RQ62_9FIRM|nr:hydroxypyruvate isomerase [Sulfobacillus thermotolerans]MCY0906937.1 hydroxypyruvate isomerase [Sulfobacillus thermotolerans]
MIRYAANLSLLYPDRPFLERFEAAKASGFSAVEFMFPYAAGLDAVQNALARNQLKLVLFNLPAGHWEDGERGIAIFPDRQEEFRAGVAEAIRYAKALQCVRINCLAGVRPYELSEDEAWTTLVANVRFAADQLAEHNIRLLVEAVNSLDIPGFFLNTPARVERLLDTVQHPNVYLQYDIYHAQRMQGELIGTFRRLAAHIGHVQIADNPGRHEPGTGEIHYDHVLNALDDAGYGGYVGLEYIPAGDTDEGLRWLPREKR